MVLDLILESSDFFKVALSLIFSCFVFVSDLSEFGHDFVFTFSEVLFHFSDLHFDLVVDAVSDFFGDESKPPFFAFAFVELLPVFVEFPVPAGVLSLGHPVGGCTVSAPEAGEIFVVSDPRWG